MKATNYKGVRKTLQRTWAGPRGPLPPRLFLVPCAAIATLRRQLPRPEPQEARDIIAIVIQRLMRRSWGAVAALLLAFTGGPALAQGGSEVWLLPIETQITPATAQFVTSRIDRANEEQPLALVLMIDTPGGRVDSMQRIVNAILNRAQLPVLAVVENAFSAGALIAMSAEQLAMLPGASIGAALPITTGPGGATAADEKFNSAVRGQFRSVAEARGRDPQVAEAMVDPSIEIPRLSASGELVTLSAQEAVDQDIADMTATDLRDALQQFGYGGVAIERLELNLTERIGTALAAPFIAGLLLVLGVGGILLEIFTPGFGVPGAIGVLALALFATSAFVATPAGIVDVLLILGGILLIAAEMLVIPGFGVAGILGFAAIIAAVIRIFQEQAVTVLGTTAVGAGLLLGVMLWMLPNSRIGSLLRLSDRIGESPAPAMATDPGTAKLVGSKDHLDGQSGRALSDLRPAGVARFGSERVDVVSEGDFIPAGSDIVVLRVEGTRVTVRAAEPDDPAPASESEA